MSDMTRNHNRKLGLCATALTTARMPKFDIEVATVVRDEIEKVMGDSGYLRSAPFEWVTIAFQYGLKNDDEPVFGKISKRYGTLPLAIELDTNELLGASREEMKRLFEIAALRSLIAAGKRYSLNYSALETHLASL